MEYQIGEKVYVRKKHTVELVVEEHEGCDGCYFMYKCKHENHRSITLEYGECSCLERKDGKNIIFKFQKEIKDVGNK